MPQDEVVQDDAAAEGPGALQTLVAEHAAYVAAVLRRCGAAEADVHDLSQEVWIVVHRRLADFEGRSALRTWLYGICRNVCREHRRRAHRRYELLGVRGPEPRIDATQHRQLEARDALHAAAQASHALPADRRELLAATALGEGTMRTMARRQRCSDKTLFSRLYAAREQLRRAMRRAGHLAVIGYDRGSMGAAAGSPLTGAALPMVLACACLLAGGDRVPAVSPPSATVTAYAAAQPVRYAPFTLLVREALSPPAQAAAAASPARVMAPQRPHAPPGPGHHTEHVEFTVLDLAEPGTELRLRQVAFMEYVPHY